MVIVDSHCHVSRAWYEPVESLLSQMDRNGVEHAVLIQIQGQTDNSYQQECVRRYPGRFASVVLVDTEPPKASETLRRLAEVEQPIPPLLEQAYEAFGSERMMWGSDLPPVSGREGYRSALRLTMEQFASRSGEERDRIFGRVALSLFPVRR